MKTATACLTMAATLGLSAAAADHSQPWLYTATAQNRGPANWGDLTGNEKCKTGREQSPVNIASAEVDTTLRKLQFSYTSTTNYKVLNNQHSEKVEFGASPGSFIDPALGNKKWNALQFHVHSPSENGVGGGLFDMELHIVHEADATQKGNTEKYSHAVISILFEASSATPNKVLDTFWSKLQSLPLSQAAHYAAPDTMYEYNSVDGTEAIDINGLLTTEEYYTFDGSLTTPPCTEGVKWYVLTIPNKMSASQLTHHNTLMDFAGLKAATPTGNPLYSAVFGNNRPLQPLNARSVKRFAPETKPTVVDVNGNVITVSESDDDDSAEKLAIAALVITCVTLLILIVFIVVSCCCRSAEPAQETAEETKDKNGEETKPDRSED